MGQIDWNNKNLIQESITNSKSRVETLQRLGYNPKGAVSRRKLNEAIKKFDLNTSSYTNQSERWDILPTVIKKCFSIADVLRSVGLTDQGDNHKTAKRVIKKFNLDISHFINDSSRLPGNKIPNDELFVSDSTAHRSIVKHRILQENIIPYRCNLCDNEGKWLDQQMVLELDHINGINNDHRVENLRFLCPNCHSVTPTHRGRNIGN